MRPRKTSSTEFVFSQSEITPEHTPEDLSPTLSQTIIAALLTPMTAPDMVAETRFDDTSIISRFFRLLHQSTLLIQTYGPYATHAGTTVFSRAPIGRDTNETVSEKDIASSLAAVQDCTGSAQVEGPAKDDLTIFENLWDITISVLELVLQTGELHHEILGWGVIGLCAGYVAHAHWREDSHLLSLKMLLHDALKQTPSMDSTHRRTKDGVASAGGMVGYLAKANREVHVCANLLLQQFRREEWQRIRWYHAVAVARRWIENLGLEGEAVPKRKESMG